MLLFANCLFATGQYGDILIEGNDTSEIYSNPLEQYLQNKKSRIIDEYNLLMTSTACWRGYQATWLIENDSIFLIKIKKGCANWGDKKPEYLNLKNEFGSNKVHAHWINEVIWKPEGELIQNVHMGYASIFEREKNYFFKNGILEDTETIENVKYDSNKLFPAERKLADTIKKIIIDRIDAEKIKKFADKEYAFIVIKFNPEGKLSSIESSFKKEEKTFFLNTILEIAKISLKDFPTLMTVKHKYYESAYIELSFSSYCLKFPDDYDYGCGR